MTGWHDKRRVALPSLQCMYVQYLIPVVSAALIGVFCPSAIVAGCCLGVSCLFGEASSGHWRATLLKRLVPFRVLMRF